MSLSDHSIANARQTDRGPYALARLALWLWSRQTLAATECCAHWVKLDASERALLRAVTTPHAA